jgi:hypothetical protein
MSLVLMAAGAMAVLVVGGYVLRGRRSAAPVMHHARCPKCDQKVRYSLDRAGRRVMCPRCGRNWALPATPQPLPAASVRSDGRRLLRHV